MFTCECEACWFLRSCACLLVIWVSIACETVPTDSENVSRHVQKQPTAETYNGQVHFPYSCTSIIGVVVGKT